MTFLLQFLTNFLKECSNSWKSCCENSWQNYRNIWTNIWRKIFGISWMYHMENFLGRLLKKKKCWGICSEICVKIPYSEQFLEEILKESLEEFPQKKLSFFWKNCWRHRWRNPSCSSGKQFKHYIRKSLMNIGDVVEKSLHWILVNKNFWTNS